MKCVIGWDQDLSNQYEVCQSTISVDTLPTDNRILRHSGSTAWTVSRFLVPHQMKYHGWHLFCDSDIYFTDDVRKLLHYVDPKYAVLVVKHEDYTPHSNMKMADKQQTAYHRKNWSSLILWNCSHEANRLLDPAFVADCNTLWLHQFGWLTDNQIGELPAEWNTLVGYQNYDNPKGIHYTDGVPTIDKYKQCDYSELWLKRHELLLREGRITVY